MINRQDDLRFSPKATEAPVAVSRFQRLPFLFGERAIRCGFSCSFVLRIRAELLRVIMPVLRLLLRVAPKGVLHSGARSLWVSSVVGAKPGGTTFFAPSPVVTSPLLVELGHGFHLSAFLAGLHEYAKRGVEIGVELDPCYIPGRTFRLCDTHSAPSTVATKLREGLPLVATGAHLTVKEGKLYNRIVHMVTSMWATPRPVTAGAGVLCASIIAPHGGESELSHG